MPRWYYLLILYGLYTRTQRACNAFPHTIIKPSWDIGQSYKYEGACEFDVVVGDVSWTINITFNKNISQMQVFNSIIIASHPDNRWICVKNKNDPQPPEIFQATFIPKFSGIVEPSGECFVLKNVETHCLDHAPVSEITTETTTTTTSTSTTTRNQQTTESLDTSSITAAITTTSQLPTITTSSETGTIVTPTETATNEQLQTESSGTSAPPPLPTITTETTSTEQPPATSSGTSTPPLLQTTTTTETTSTEQFLTTSSGTSTPPTTTTTTTETVSTDRLPTISPGTSIPPTLLTTTIKEITSTEHLPTTSSTSRTPSQPISIEQYSTSPVTVNEVSSDQTKMDLDCLCSCEDLHEMSQQEFLEMLESLQIDKSKLSATRRKLTSAPDNRVESKSMGVFGIVVISIVVGLFILADLSSLLQAGSLSGGKLFKQS